MWPVIWLTSSSSFIVLQIFSALFEKSNGFTLSHDMPFIPFLSVEMSLLILSTRMCVSNNQTSVELRKGRLLKYPSVTYRLWTTIVSSYYIWWAPLALWYLNLSSMSYITSCLSILLAILCQNLVLSLTNHVTTLSVLSKASISTSSFSYCFCYVLSHNIPFLQILITLVDICVISHIKHICLRHVISII